MNKSSQIRKKLEEYGFQKIGRKNCFLAYLNNFCFQIIFQKVGYGARWEILSTIHMLNAKQYEIGKCPEKLFLLDSLPSISLSEWEVDKGEKVDKYSKSIIFILEEYIVPYFSKVALYKKVSDFESSIYITKVDEPIIFLDKFKFKPMDLIEYRQINQILTQNDFSNLNDMLEFYSYKYITEKEVREINFEFHFTNEQEKSYLILIIELNLFISFELLTEEAYRDREEIGFGKSHYITYFKDKSFSFGWNIADQNKRDNNLPLVLEKLRIAIENKKNV